MKIWLFRAIALLLPVLFFVVLEMSLRLAGFGKDYPLFIENPANSHYILPRPDVVKRYFSQNAVMPSVTMEANFLLKDKPKDGIRVFVQGGSTAAGFPYGLGASLAGMLDQRLKRSLPGYQVEVVNTALAAVNSYTLLDLTDEIIEQQPDAVLIYAGHNEYLGLLGVGSNFTAANSQGTTLLFLKVKSFRTFQLMQQIYQWITQTQPDEDNSIPASRTFMAQVAKHKNIELDSALYDAGLTQFETNLSLILQKYQAAGVPVFVATIASNILDQKPFSSDAASPELASRLAKLQGSTQAWQQKHTNELLSLSQAALQSSSAQLNFEIGRLFAALKQSSKAHQHLSRAKDLDLLRFRAPEKINQLIRTVSAQYSATVVDVESRMQQQSPQSLIGNNLMLEHLHPNVQGYFLLADTFYQSLASSGLFSGWQHIATADGWKLRPLLPAEEYHGFAKALRLMTDYPFTDEPKPLVLPKPGDWQQQLGKQHFANEIDWMTMINRSYNGYRQQNNTAMADKALLILADALPHDPKVNLAAANMLSASGQPGVAVTYYKRAILAGDESQSTQQALQQAVAESRKS